MNTLKLEEFIPYRLNRISVAVSNRARLVYSARYSLTVPEWRALASIGQFRRMTAKEIALHSSMHKTKVSRAVAELDARRWIRREENTEDRRQDYLTLSALGQQVYNEIVPDMLTFEDKLKRQLGTKITADLLSVLDRLEALTEV